MSVERWNLRLVNLYLDSALPSSHLDGVGVILRAADHPAGPVEARRRLEGDGEVVGLGDVLHGGRAGVGLHDGRELKGQDEREQLLQQRDGESRRSFRNPQTSRGGSKNGGNSSSL